MDKCIDIRQFSAACHGAHADGQKPRFVRYQRFHTLFQNADLLLQNTLLQFLLNEDGELIPSEPDTFPCREDLLQKLRRLNQNLVSAMMSQQIIHAFEAVQIRVKERPQL